MDTRGKSNMEFRNDVQEALARHESTFDQIHNNLQTIMTELQSLRVSGSQNNQPLDNPFAVENSHNQPTQFNHPQNHFHK